MEDDGGMADLPHGSKKYLTQFKVLSTHNNFNTFNTKTPFMRIKNPAKLACSRSPHTDALAQ
jgi:hypothetical protein